jgi:hypothetical protein
MDHPERTCFVICPLGAEGSDVRRRSDLVLKHVLAPVLRANGFHAVRADHVPKVGLITTQIINLIVESPLVVADLTGSNPNVFYELAIRHAIRKPYVQLIAKGERIPFDVSGIRTIELDVTDLDSVDRAKREMDRQIKEFGRGHLPDSPVSIASAARLLQDDRDLAAEIAEKLSYLGDEHALGLRHGGGARGAGGYGDDDSEKVEKIYRKLWGLNDFSLVTLEDLSAKLDAIAGALERLASGKAHGG